MSELPWFAEFVDGGLDVGLNSVGERRTLMAAAARSAACRAFRIADPPKMRFFDARSPSTDGVKVRSWGVPLGEFRHGDSLIPGTILVASGQTLLKTACVVVHECTHQLQSLRAGDLRYVSAVDLQKYERQAAIASEDFERFLGACYDTSYGSRSNDPGAVKWARTELWGFSSTRPAWTPPESVLL